MIVQTDPKAKLTILREYTKGWYRGHYDVQVEHADGVKYLVSAMSKAQYELEQFLLGLDLPKDKMDELCDKIDEFGSYRYKEGGDSEAEAQSYRDSYQ